MAIQAEMMGPAIREQLAERRQKLVEAAASGGDAEGLGHLLREVDAALERLTEGKYGLCEVCHDPIEPERLQADPLLRLCLDHLTAPQQRALEEDLDLASRIQSRLLPERAIRAGIWEVVFSYESAGVVGGDYCDVVQAEGGGLHLFAGDVSGKGVAASMLMSHLHGTFRTLVSLGVPLVQMVQRANHLFCESTLPNHYATLLCARVTGGGDVEICNAGHLPPVLAASGGTRLLQGAGLPLGMFCEASYGVAPLHLEPGDSLVFYTDGLTETRSETGEEYGRERLRDAVGASQNLPPEGLLRSLLADLDRFRGMAPRVDDLTVLVLRRSE